MTWWEKLFMYQFTIIQQKRIAFTGVKKDKWVLLFKAIFASAFLFRIVLFLPGPTAPWAHNCRLREIHCSCCCHTPTREGHFPGRQRTAQWPWWQRGRQRRSWTRWSPTERNTHRGQVTAQRTCQSVIEALTRHDEGQWPARMVIIPVTMNCREIKNDKEAQERRTIF